MAQYIDKAAIEAEIDRVLNSYDPNEITSGRYALSDLRDFLNTLESKELYLDDTSKETPSNKTLFNKTDSTLEDAWNKLYAALHKVHELEKAIIDSGYTFNFYSKELNELEEYDGDDYGIDSLWHARHILKKTLGKVDGYQSDDGILEHKCAISAVDKLYKQKPVWSLEDTFKVQRICKYLDAAKYYADSTEARECIDWLKSFEERVIPKQKQEWSEEDESNFQMLIDSIKENKHHATDYEHMKYYKLLSWFKSLKNRYVRKPSDEQMKALDWALSLAKNCGEECSLDLRTLQDQLKKLK